MLRNKLYHQLQIEYIKRSAPRTFIKAGGALRFLSQNDSEVFCFGRFEIKFKRLRIGGARALRLLLCRY